jgi:hypothetical protein
MTTESPSWMTVECGFCSGAGRVNTCQLKLYTRPMHSLVKGRPSLDRNWYYGVCTDCRKEQRSTLPSTPHGRVHYAFIVGTDSTAPYSPWSHGPSEYLDGGDPYVRYLDSPEYDPIRWKPNAILSASTKAAADAIETLVLNAFEWAGEYGFCRTEEATKVWYAAKFMRPDLEPRI